jgi:hypothetical protein
VITHGFWQRRLGTEADPLGQTLTLDGQTFTIIGVMPPEFVFPSASTEIFLPMGFYAQSMCWDIRGCSQGSWAMGRLKPGVTMAMAQDDMDRVHRELEEREGAKQARVELESLTESYVGDVSSQIWVLMGAVAFVLLIACANVASLLLARGEGPASAAWYSNSSRKAWYSPLPVASSEWVWGTSGCGSWSLP